MHSQRHVLFSGKMSWSPDLELPEQKYDGTELPVVKSTKDLTVRVFAD